MKPLIKKAIGAMSYSSYSFLNLLFYKKKKKIVFMSFPDATDNSWHLYKYALDNLKDYEFVWLINGNSETVRKKIIAYGNNISNDNKINIIKRWSVKGLMAFSSAKFVFHTHGTYYFIKKSFNAPTIVNLWHGMPIKAIGLLDKVEDKNFCYSDYSIATSNSYRKIISNAFNLPIDKVLVTGLPRNDVLYSGISDDARDKILSRLNLKTDKDIIVWLPTYRVSSFGDIRSDALNTSFLDDLDDSFLEELDVLCSQNNVKVIVKLHPMDSISEALKDLSFSNIQFYDAVAWEYLDIELYDLLSLSKGIVSDFSSVMIDCLPTDINVSFINSSREQYNRKTVISVDDLLECVETINFPIDIVKLTRLENTESNKNDISVFSNSSEGEACYKILKELNI